MDSWIFQQTKYLANHCQRLMVVSCAFHFHPNKTPLSIARGKKWTAGLIYNIVCSCAILYITQTLYILTYPISSPMVGSFDFTCVHKSKTIELSIARG